jgi:hypothetical protein
MVQRQFSKLGIPRMYRSAGTDSPTVLAAINAMLTELAAEGEGEILNQLNEGKRTFIEVLKRYKKVGVEGVSQMAGDAPATEAAFEDWLSGHTSRATTQTSYRSSYRTLRLWLKANSTMQDIPAAMKRYRAACVKANRNYRAWDHTLAVCKAWTKGTLGKRSAVYASLQDLKAFHMSPSHRENIYFSPRDVQNVMQRLSDDVAAMVWTMALHGLGPKEYMVDGTKVDGNGLIVFGEKNSHRQRTVPLIEPPAPLAPIGYKTLHAYITKASDGALKPYDLRRSYARWLLAADVPYNRVMTYMGHKPRAQTDQYAWHKVDQFLAVDGEKFRLWIAAELAKEPPSADTVKVVREKVRGFSGAAAPPFRPEIIEPRRPARRRRKEHAIKVTRRGRLLVNGREPDQYSVVDRGGVIREKGQKI